MFAAELLPLNESLTVLKNLDKKFVAELEALEIEGLTDERPSWYRKKYLYMVSSGRSQHPRVRRYIGSNKVKQGKELAAFERTKRHKELKTVRDRINAHTIAVHQRIELLVVENNKFAQHIMNITKIESGT